MKSMILLRRSLVLAALMFWQGGFVFYAAVVVPVAQAQIGHRSQGFITAEVTNYLNWAGAIALVPFAWDTAATFHPRRWMRRLLDASWAGMLATLLFLFALHHDLTVSMAGGEFEDLPRFHAVHRWYLWTSTVQWALAVGYAILTLSAWRTHDQSAWQGRDGG